MPKACFAVDKYYSCTVNNTDGQRHLVNGCAKLYPQNPKDMIIFELCMPTPSTPKSRKIASKIEPLRTLYKNRYHKGKTSSTISFFSFQIVIYIYIFFFSGELNHKQSTCTLIFANNRISTRTTHQ